MNDEKTKNLDLAISQIEKQYGKGSIMRLGNKDVLVPVNVIPTGSISIDAALGVGGFPRGRVIEVYGPESGGKTTLTLHVIAEAQRLGGQAAFIDAEHALDPSYARKLGVDVDNLLVSQPDNGEQALEIAEALIRSNAVAVSYTHLDVYKRQVLCRHGPVPPNLQGRKTKSLSRSNDERRKNKKFGSSDIAN